MICSWSFAHRPGGSMHRTNRVTSRAAARRRPARRGGRPRDPTGGMRPPRRTARRDRPLPGRRRGGARHPRRPDTGLPALELSGRRDRRAPGQDDQQPTWFVDPNDGTSTMQRGYRGHAISIGLVQAGAPVLGVVWAVDAPDDRGDLICWAEGCGPLRRNGVALPVHVWSDHLNPHDVVGTLPGRQSQSGRLSGVRRPGAVCQLPEHRLSPGAGRDRRSRRDPIAQLSTPVGLRRRSCASARRRWRGGGRARAGNHVSGSWTGHGHADFRWSPDRVVLDLIHRRWEGASRSGFGDAAPPPRPGAGTCAARQARPRPWTFSAARRAACWASWQVMRSARWWSSSRRIALPPGIRTEVPPAGGRRSAHDRRRPANGRLGAGARPGAQPDRPRGLRP